MLLTVNWTKLGYPRAPIPRSMPGYGRLVWEWYRDNGYIVPHNSAEYRSLLAGKTLQLSKVRYRPGVRKPSDIPKSTPGYAKLRRRYKQNDDLFPLPPLEHKIHYVYEYIRPDNNTSFYVGCGKAERALNWKYSRSPEFMAIVAELKNKGLEPAINMIAANLSSIDARMLELKMIKERITTGHKLTNKFTGVAWNELIREYMLRSIK